MRRIRLPLPPALLLLGVLLSLPAGAALACTITQEGRATLADAGPLRIAPVTVDGKPGRFVLDTGSEKTVVSPDGKQALGLATDTWTSTGMTGIGGTEWHPDATVASMVLGGVALTRRLGPIRSVPVLPHLPGVMGTPGVDGLLGADLLGGHDVELADHARLLILHRVTGCSGAFLPWAAAMVPADYPRAFLPVVPVAIGGLALRALLDTGAQISLITTRAAARLHGGAPLGSATAAGVGPGTLPLEVRRFGPVSVGGLILPDGPLYVAALPATGFDAVLGMDRLRDLHLWVSYATRQVMLAQEPGVP